MEMLSGGSTAAKRGTMTAPPRRPAAAAPAKTAASSGGAPVASTAIKKRSAPTLSLSERKPRPNTAVDSRRTVMGAAASQLAGPLGTVGAVRPKSALDQNNPRDVTRPRSGLAGSTKSKEQMVGLGKSMSNSSEGTRSSGSRVMAGRVVYQPKSIGVPSKQQPISARRATAKDAPNKRAASTQPGQQSSSGSNQGGSAALIAPRPASELGLSSTDATRENTSWPAANDGSDNAKPDPIRPSFVPLLPLDKVLQAVEADAHGDEEPAEGEDSGEFC